VPSDAQEYRRRLVKRAKRIAMHVPADQAQQLAQYLQLLATWNSKVNLTALDDVDAAVDRLILEPLLAARYVPETGALMDVGSGGGSPAVPLKIARPDVHLRMVESKTRKGAFLREVVRQLGLEDAVVENRRYEELLTRPELHESMDVVTIRAIRVDGHALMGIQTFVKPLGEILLFRGPGPSNIDRLAPPLELLSEEPLLEPLRSRLVRIGKMDVGPCPPGFWRDRL
jgi:16S rRNA (guanine527-N7)-methyltransferase